MDGFAAIDYGFAREVLQRGIAALYLVAFVSTLNQFRPLLGERGLLPAPALLEWVAARDSRKRMLNPTLFRRIRYTDRRLVTLCVGGIVVSALLVAGIPQLAPPWVPMICFLLLWGGYMSIVSIGQTFYSFGWEMLLLECGFLAAFLGSSDQPPPAVVIVLFWWLLFRLEFGAGMIKIRGGREWRDLTALTYHHETQPMPGPLSRQAHLLPRWFHKGEVIGNHFVGILYVVLSWPSLRNLAARRQLMNASFNRWQLANAYGAFGTVTKQRVEIVVEGCLDDEGFEWREYEFKGKPGDVRRIPRQFAPYHLRLDWLMWFLPLGRSLDDWFTAFLVRLLEADAPTLALLRTDPFHGERPRWVRAVSYRYRFATRTERRDHGVRWVRTGRRVILGPVGLK